MAQKFDQNDLSLPPERMRPRNQSRNGRSRKAKFFVFTLLPVMTLIVVSELTVRISGLDKPAMKAPFLPTHLASLEQHDDQLFWVMRPNLQVKYQGVDVVTNSLGLRSPEISVKKKSEFRILSLGESTTFGAGVEGNQTYSAKLQEYLNKANSSREFRIINAGVCAYSTFQSVKYLELHGVKLKPDMILFYHEVNDRLASSVRGGRLSDESAIALSDQQLYQSQKFYLHQKLLNLSAVYRVLTYFQARKQIDTVSRSSNEVSRTSGRKLLTSGTVQMFEEEVEFNLPRRVPIDEKLDLFTKLLSICVENGIQLVMIHPSYRASTRHECMLTDFCQRTNVPMFEAYDSLHLDETHSTEMFLDFFHPSSLGHELIAKNLFRFLVEQNLVPASNKDL